MSGAARRLKSANRGGSMRKLAVLVGILTIGVPPAAVGEAAAAARFVDPIQGFAMEVPALGTSKEAPAMLRLTVAGPPEGGFATNCNVQVQFVTLSLAAFMDLSLRQFAARGLTVHERRDRTVSGRPAASFEYGGDLNGRKLRFAALAVAGEDRIWLLTCTALEERFAAHRAEFQAVLDSFALVDR